MSGKKVLKAGIFCIIIFAATFWLILSGAFYSWDKILADKLCQTPEVPDSNIYILAIDEKTLQEYGSMSGWGRDIFRQTVEILNKEEQKRPAVICFDIMFIDQKEKEEDLAFAQVCLEAGNVIAAMSFQFREQPKMQTEGRYIFNPFYVERVSYPFKELAESADYGFSNTVVDKDGYVRRAIAQVKLEDETVYSLAGKIYNNYMKQLGKEPVMPKLDQYQQFYFQYAGKTGAYSVVSLCDLLDKTVDPAIFTGGIVMIGAYAPGLFDSYMPAISHNQQMYGVEVQANIVDALIHGRTQKEFSVTVYALTASTAAVLFYLCTRKLGALFSAGLMAAGAAGSIVLVKAAYHAGYILPVLIFPAVLVLLYIASVIEGYLEESRRRKQIVGVFKKYVAPQIVDDISKNKEFKVALGGEKRHIAVLFVDIRGFTTMSESLKPEEVVEILNEYLALTTDSIFRNCGTLDKFVGDATMAVFNAPFDLNDYIYRAVKAAWDMKAGADALADRFTGKFGKCVSFGIGIHCGEAIVGNIGCEFRMDYTAIGDTVNTASRLESNARAGQILISEAVYKAVKERIEVNPIGEIPLKGKEQRVFVYQVVNVK